MEIIQNADIQDISADEVKAEAGRLYEYLQEQMPSLIGFCVRVVLAIVVFLVARKLIAWGIRVLKKSLDNMNVDEGVVQFACSAARLLLYLLLIFNIAISFGITESSVAALLGTAGVTVGLALQGGLANVAGGVMILLFKPFQVGDYIIQDQANGCEGTVSRIDMYYTTLLSVDNKNIVIPNGTLANSTVINVTARNHRRLEIKVGISYRSDIRRAREILEQILLDDPDTNTDSEMVVFVDELGESAVIMGLRVWVETDNYWPVKWRLNQRIKEEFDSQGIVIPFNQMDVHIHQQENK